MANMYDIVQQALERSGEPAAKVLQDNTTDTKAAYTQAIAETTEGITPDTERLIIDCVLEVVQMPCFNMKQLADIRRTLRNVLKALVKEKDYITLGIIKRYIDQRNRGLVKSILAHAVNVGLVLTVTVEDTVTYKLNHQHADAIFNYVEKTT